MADIAVLTLADGQSTPVNHTFSPVRIDSAGVAKWVDRVGGIAIGFPTVTLSIREPSKGQKDYKVIRKVVVPVLDISSPSTSTGIQPAPSRAFELKCTTEWALPERSTAAQRADLLAYCKNFDATTVLTDCVKNFEAIY